MEETSARVPSISNIIAFIYSPFTYFSVQLDRSYNIHTYYLGMKNRMVDASKQDRWRSFEWRLFRHNFYNRRWCVQASRLSLQKKNFTCYEYMSKSGSAKLSLNDNVRSHRSIETVLYVPNPYQKSFLCIWFSYDNIYSQTRILILVPY